MHAAMSRGSTVFVLLVCAVTTATAGFFKFEDCSGENAIAEVSQFRISPDPVNLRENMTVDMVVKMLRDVPPDAVLRTRYYKLKSVFGVNIDIPIPCLLGKFGSCTLPLCEYLKMFRDQVEAFFPPDKEYGCPVQAGDYGGENMETEIPDMSLVARIIVRSTSKHYEVDTVLIPRFIDNGRYRTELKLLDKRYNGKELACYKVLAEIK